MNETFELNNNLFYGHYKIYSIEKLVNADYWYTEEHGYCPNPHSGKEYFLIKSQLCNFTCHEDNENFDKIRLLYYRMKLESDIDALSKFGFHTNDLIELVNDYTGKALT